MRFKALEEMKKILDRPWLCLLNISKHSYNWTVLAVNELIPRRTYIHLPYKCYIDILKSAFLADQFDCMPNPYFWGFMCG